MRLLAKLDTSFEAIAKRRGGALRLETAGANRFAVAAEQSVKRDVYAIGVCSFLGVAALFFLFIGGWRAFLIVSVPPLAGILVATSCGLAILGNIDGLTMAFGASLMGIAIDYSNHLLIHNRLSASPETPSITVRRIRPSLTLGAATTIASFGGLAVTAFPAFREMSLFAAIGVGAALLASLKLLPALLPFSPALPDRSAVVAAWLGERLLDLERAPRALLFAPIALLPVAAIALTKLEWIDDMSELTNFPEALLEEGRRVRERVSSMDSSRFAIGVAPDTASAVELNDRIAAQIAPISLKAVGHDGQVFSIQALSHRNQLVGSHFDAGGVVKRKRRLRQDGREHRGLEHHRECEVAGETHPDRANTWTPAFLVRQSSQRPKPRGHWARLVGCQCAELGADARTLEDGRALLDIRHRTITAEQRRHVYGESCISNPAAEACYLRANARHLSHNDHCRAGASHVDHLRDAVQGNLAGIEVFEQIVLVHVAFRHRSRSVSLNGSLSSILASLDSRWGSSLWLWWCPTDRSSAATDSADRQRHVTESRRQKATESRIGQLSVVSCRPLLGGEHCSPRALLR